MSKVLKISINTLGMLDGLTDIEVAQLFRAIKAHLNNEEYGINSPTAKLAYSFFIREIDNFNLQSITNKENIKRRWEKSKLNIAEEVVPKVEEPIPIPEPEPIPEPVPVVEVEEVTEEPVVAKPIKRYVFVKPTIDEIREYLISKGYEESLAESIYDYYESNGWRVGKNKMKDWRAACRTWVRNEKNGYGRRETAYERNKRSQEQLKRAVAESCIRDFERERNKEDTFRPLIL